MAYKMVSKYGNAIYNVETSRERDEFLRKGYTEEKPNKIAVKKTTDSNNSKKKNSSKKRGTNYEKNQN